MKELYTVGEVAKIFNVSSDTFRFYDKLGVIKPWEVAANGYRYYHKAQFELINTILLLRNAGTPLERLPEIFGAEDTTPMITELEKHTQDIEQQIKQLKALAGRIGNLHNNIADVSGGDAGSAKLAGTSTAVAPAETPASAVNSAGNIKLTTAPAVNPAGNIKLTTAPALWMISRKFAGAEDELDLEEISKVYKVTDSSWIFFANTFSTISKEDLYAGNYHIYQRYGFISEYPCDSQSDDLSCMESQLCVCATVKSTRLDLRDIYPTYEKIKTFIAERGYRVTGETIERNIVDLYSAQKKQFTHHFKLYVPVEKG